jgi:hypothetical protein
MVQVVFALAMAVVLVFSGIPAAIAESIPPIPPLPEKYKGIKMIQPDPAVPKEIKDFLGEWEGVWVSRAPGIGGLPRETRRAKLIVYQVAKDKVYLLSGVSTNPFTKMPEGWREVEADITERGEKIRFSWMGLYGYRQEEAKNEFYLENGVLYGTVGRASIDMKRVK